MLFVHTATSAHVAAIHRQILADDIVPANLFSTLQRCHIERYRGCLNDRSGTRDLSVIAVHGKIKTLVIR